MPTISGIVKIKVDGETLESLPGATLDIGGETREMKAGHRVYGSVSKIKHSECKFQIVWKFDTPIEAIRSWRDKTLLFESDNGKKYQVPNATTLETLTLPDSENDIEVTMGGDVAEPL